jgi:O6-methylguanine-DNA--protein-cysteine methyltransferase
VLAANGMIGGFMHSRDSLPLGIKRWLLAHEGR